MSDNYAEIKAQAQNVFLITEEKISKFTAYCPYNPNAGADFVRDCEKLGWPALTVDRDIYIFATRRAAR